MDTIRPARPEVSTRPNIIGRMATPLLVAGTPRPICRYSGRKVTTPMNDMEMKNEAVVVVTNGRMRNRESGITGSDTTRSTRTKAIRPAANIANRPRMTGEVQGCVWPPQLRASISEATETAIRAAPAKSIFASLRRLDSTGMRVMIMNRARIASGRLR